MSDSVGGGKPLPQRAQFGSKGSNLGGFIPSTAIGTQSGNQNRYSGMRGNARGGGNSRDASRAAGSTNVNSERKKFPPGPRGSTSVSEELEFPALPNQYAGILSDDRVDRVSVVYQRGKHPKIEVTAFGMRDDGSIDLTTDKVVLSYSGFVAYKERAKSLKAISEVRVRIEQQIELLKIDTRDLANTKYLPLFDSPESYKTWSENLTELEHTVLTAPSHGFRAYFGLDPKSDVGFAEALAREERAARLFPNIKGVLGALRANSQTPYTPAENTSTAGSALRSVRADLRDDEVIEIVRTGGALEEDAADVEDWNILDVPAYGDIFISNGRVYTFSEERKCYRRRNKDLLKRVTQPRGGDSGSANADEQPGETSTQAAGNSDGQGEK